MTDQDDAGQPPEMDEDLGPPVAQLLGHTIPVAPDFRERVSRSIERRVLAADATRFGVMGPISALMELLRAVFESLGFIDSEPDDDSSVNAPADIN